VNWTYWTVLLIFLENLVKFLISQNLKKKEKRKKALVDELAACSLGSASCK
jgi:hypothetical protein